MFRHIFDGLEVQYAKELAVIRSIISLSDSLSPVCYAVLYYDVCCTVLCCALFFHVFVKPVDSSLSIPSILSPWLYFLSLLPPFLYPFSLSPFLPSLIHFLKDILHLYNLHVCTSTHSLPFPSHTPGRSTHLTPSSSLRNP